MINLPKKISAPPSFSFAIRIREIRIKRLNGKFGADGDFLARFGSLIVQVNLAAGYRISSELARFKEARSP